MFSLGQELSTLTVKGNEGRVEERQESTNYSPVRAKKFRFDPLLRLSLVSLDDKPRPRHYGQLSAAVPSLDPSVSTQSLRQNLRNLSQLESSQSSNRVQKATLSASTRYDRRHYALANQSNDVKQKCRVIYSRRNRYEKVKSNTNAHTAMSVSRKAERDEERH